jgi:hypothetical protein
MKGKMKMNNKSKIIITLLIIGTLLYSVVLFVIIPHNNARQKKYNIDQNDSLTHDIENVMDYKSDYIGDMSNAGNLFYHLPLNTISMKFELNPDECAFTVNYNEIVSNVGKDKVNRDLIYNSAAAMALIDNLKKITYRFNDDKFVFTRKQIENAFAGDLSSLLNKKTWNEKVQSRLKDVNFIRSFY